MVKCTSEISIQEAEAGELHNCQGGLSYTVRVCLRKTRTEDVIQWQNASGLIPSTCMLSQRWGQRRGG